MTKKKYQVALVRTEYFHAMVEVEADNEEQARDLADASEIEDWGAPVDADVEIGDWDDAVMEIE